jgi:carbon-monoxide dehydrogenase medium subunit
MKPFDYAAPKTLSEAVALLAGRPDKARVLAGGTDLLVQLREGRRDADLVIDVKRVPDLADVRFDPQRGLQVGAAVPCYRVAEHPDVARLYPGLTDAASLVGGVQIQSRATLAGNLCNASPAADTVPAMIACEGVAVVAGAGGTRSVPVEQFCVGPGKTVLGPGELLVSLTFPAPRAGSSSAYLRFIPRNEMDIAVVGAGVAVTLDGPRCAAARIALCAVAPTPILVPDAGAALVGTNLDMADLDRAGSIAQAAAKPISDMRGDAEYRRHLVGVLVKRALRIALARAKEK